MAAGLANKLLAVVGIALVALSLVNSPVQVQNITRGSGIFDPRLIPALKNISVLVPAGEVIVVSSEDPYVTYFTGHIAKVPWGVSSEESLVEYMRHHHYSYLVVFEEISDNRKLKPLFSQVRNLETNFQLLGTFKTTGFSTIYLYKLRPSG